MAFILQTLFFVGFFFEISLREKLIEGAKTIHITLNEF